MIDEACVRAALNAIIDPCSVTAQSPAGIEELGLIRRLELIARDDGTLVRVAIGVTEPGCVMGFPFAREARQRLAALPGVASVEVELDHAHDWMPADMSPSYRARLAADRALRQGATGIQLVQIRSGTCNATE